MSNYDDLLDYLPKRSESSSSDSLTNYLPIKQSTDTTPAEPNDDSSALDVFRDVGVEGSGGLLNWAKVGGQLGERAGRFAASDNKIQQASDSIDNTITSYFDAPLSDADRAKAASVGGKTGFENKSAQDIINTYNVKTKDAGTPKADALFDPLADDLAAAASDAHKQQLINVNALIEAGDVTGVMAYVTKHPALALTKTVASLPYMLGGGALGGVGVKALTKLGAGEGKALYLGSSFGEGGVEALGTYAQTGDPVLATASLLTGGIPAPSGVTPTLAADAAGIIRSGVNKLSREGVVPAVLRAGNAIGQEAVQEGLQSYTQDIIGQVAEGLDGGVVNQNKAIGGAAFGSMIGAFSAGGTHLIGGEGSKGAELKDASAILSMMENNPDTPTHQIKIAQATVNRLQAEYTIVESRTEPTADQSAILTIAQAEEAAARNPNNRELRDTADTLKATHIVETTTPQQRTEATDTAVQATQELISQATNVDDAIDAFAANQDASSVGRIVTRGVEVTQQGVQEASFTREESDAAAEDEEVRRVESELAAQAQAEQEARDAEIAAAEDEEVRRVESELAARAQAEQEARDAEIAAAEDASQDINLQALSSEDLRVMLKDPSAGSRTDAIGDVLESRFNATTNSDYNTALQRYAEYRGMVPETAARIWRHRPARMLRELLDNPSVNWAAKEFATAEIARRLSEDNLLPAQATPTTTAPAATENREQVYQRALEAYATSEGVSSTQAETAWHNISDSRVLEHAQSTTPNVATMARAVATFRGLDFDEPTQAATIRNTWNSRDDADVESRTQSSDPQEAEMARAVQAYRAAGGQRTNSSNQSDTTQSENGPDNTEGVRRVTQSFEARAQQAKRSGALKKLGTFWKKLMAKPNQRVLPAIDFSDLKPRVAEAVVTNNKLPQAIADEIKDRYNAKFKEMAIAWGEANGKPVDVANWVNPIEMLISMPTTGRAMGATIYSYPLGRNGANPYAVAPNNNRVESSYLNSEIHTAGLRGGSGSGDLHYRIFAQIADLRGSGVRSAITLLYVNSLRRQLQSLSADTLFRVGTINPLTSSGSQGPQGISPSTWRDATAVEKVGLNALRAAHSITEYRANSRDGYTSARMFENLVFNSRGEIIAATKPKDPRGFPLGTVVTEAMLRAKIGEVNPVTGKTTFATDNANSGGVGADTARLAILNNTVLNFVENDSDASIPTWLNRVAEEVGKQQGGWFFSETKGEVKTPITESRARRRLADMLGVKFAKALIDSGAITFVETGAQLTGDPSSSKNSKIQGFTRGRDGKIALVLGNLTEETFDGVALHEALHSVVRNMLGEDLYTKFESRITDLMAQGKGSSWLNDAMKRVPKDTHPANVAQEVMAYAVELYNKGKATSNPLFQWAKEFIAAVKFALMRSNLLPESVRISMMENLTDADLSMLAIVGLKSGMMGGSPSIKGNFGLTQQDSSADYSTALAEAKASGGMFDSVSTPDPKVLKDSKVFLAENGKAGFAITAEGDLIGVFNNSDSKGFAKEAIKVAVENGAKTLDAFEGPLTDIYAKNGFVETKRVKWDDQYAPTNWDYAKNGRPDIVYMAYKGDVNSETPSGETLDAVHYSSQRRGVITGEHYGTGMKGAEARRLEGPENADLRNRSHFYIGNNITPESGVGGVAHNVTLTNMYDFKNDPDGLLKGKGFNENEKERAVMAAGYNGYYVGGNAVVLGDHAISTTNSLKEGDGMFSMAEATDTVAEPTTEAPSNELNIRNHSARDGLARTTETLRKYIQDKHVTLRRIQDLAGITVENVKMHTAGALDRLGSRLMTAQRDLVSLPLDRIVAILHTAGYTKDDGRIVLEEYLKNRHAPEYNNRIATLNPATFDEDGNYVDGFDLDEHPASGIKTSAANEAVRIQEMDESPKGLAIKEAAAVYDSMIRDLQDYAVERGLETAETVAAWREINPYYTPFNRDLDIEDSSTIGSAPGTSGLSLRAGISRKAMGSSADIVSPLASTMLWGLKTTKRGENAVVARTVLAFAKATKANYMDKRGNWKPMWKVADSYTKRTVKNVIVYHTMLADGTLSPEFYTREKAENYARMQRRAGNTNVSVVRPYGGVAQPRVVLSTIPNVLNEKGVITIPVDGENQTVKFDLESEDARAIYESLTKTTEQSDLLTIPRMFTRWVMATSTGFNPVFAAFNAARDIQGAMVSTGADKIPGWTSSDSVGIGKGFLPAASEILSHLNKSFKASHDSTADPVIPAAGSMAEWVEKMEAAGGATGVSQSINDMSDAATQLRRMFGADTIAESIPENQVADFITKSGGVVAKVGDVFYNLGEGTSDIKGTKWLSKNIVSATARLNTAAELATRTLVFKRATELYMADGKTEAQAMELAAVISKNVSTNFNRRGESSTTINSLVPFFNAAVQGSYRLAEVLFEKETFTVNKNGKVVTDQRTKLTSFGKKVIAGAASIGGLQALLLLAAGFDDDDIPDYIKDKGFIIPTGGRSYAIIPMPHGFNTVINMGRELTDAVIQTAQGNVRKGLGHVAHGTLGQLSQFNPLGAAGNQILAVTPAILDIPVALYMNENAFGQKISREDSNSANPTPGFTRSKEGATQASQWLAEFANYATGGNDNVVGGFSPTPEQIDYVFGQMGGGVAREVVKTGGSLIAAGKAIAGVPQEPRQTKDMPFISRVYGDAGSSQTQRNKLYTITAEVNQHAREYKDLLVEDKAAAAEYLAEHPEIRLRSRLSQFQSKDSKARKARRKLRDGGDAEGALALTDKQDAKVKKLLDDYEQLK